MPYLGNYAGIGPAVVREPATPAFRGPRRVAQPPAQLPTPPAAPQAVPPQGAPLVGPPFGGLWTSASTSFGMAEPGAPSPLEILKNIDADVAALLALQGVNPPPAPEEPAPVEPPPEIPPEAPVVELPPEPEPEAPAPEEPMPEAPPPEELPPEEPPPPSQATAQDALDALGTYFDLTVAPEELFPLLDADGDGVLSQVELEDNVIFCGGTAESAHALYALLDLGGTGAVGFDQFAANFRPNGVSAFA